MQAYAFTFGQQKCRTPQQIAFEFDELQKDLEIEISEGPGEAAEQLRPGSDRTGADPEPCRPRLAREADDANVFRVGHRWRSA